MFSTRDGPGAVRAAVEATLRGNEEHHRHSALPKLGLPAAWVGERQTGASWVRRCFSHSTGAVDRSTTIPDQQWEMVELIHGSYPDGPWLAVATSNAPAEELVPSVSTIVREEIEAARPDSGPFERLEPTAVLVQVGRQLHVLAGVTLANFAVARTEMDGWTLTVKSRDWPLEEPIELVRLDDVEAYLDGRRDAVQRAMGL